MGTNCNICSNKCYGVDGYHGSCCSIEERNYIIGPHHDTEEFIKNLSEKLGREVSEDEVFIKFVTIANLKYLIKIVKNLK